MKIPEIILKQLGGNKFIAMTGMKNAVGSNNGLTVILPRAKDGITHIEIKLKSNDLYMVKFGKIVKYEYKVLHEHDDVYSDSLKGLISDKTGLLLSI